MTVKTYPQLNEQVITETMPNGLTVTLIPKPDYHKTFAVLTTNFGAIDRQFTLDGEEIVLPAGTAHFFEHKIFEKADGDAFVQFGAYGADANAFTNANQTSYLFATTAKLHENLDLLLDFVQTPYFTADGVAREQGIIGQEIQMYQDDPNWALYSGLLSTLYPNSVIADDVAGTIESIAQITPELLYQVHAAFYQPTNLHLKVVGKFDVAEILTWIQANQARKTFTKATVTREPLALTPGVSTATRAMSVVRPRVVFGWRGANAVPQTRDGARQALAMDLVTDLLFGEQTDWYQDLYERGVIDTDFSVEYQVERGYHFLGAFAETDDMAALKSALQARLVDVAGVLHAEQAGFEALKRATLGEAVQRLNSLESIALRSEEQLLSINVFDEMAVLQALTFEDTLNTALDFFTHATQHEFSVTPR